MGLGTSPFRIILSRFRVGSGMGEAKEVVAWRFIGGACRGLDRLHRGLSLHGEWGELRDKPSKAVMRYNGTVQDRRAGLHLLEKKDNNGEVDKW